MVLEVKKPRPMWEILFSTHHTDIGLLYIITSISFLIMGGALALAIRSELFLPGQQIFQSPNDFERFFTVHGTTMLLLWVIPFGAGVGNYLIPIMVRYKDMAWPKLNAVAYWMIPVAGALIWLGFSDTGWTAYAPYSIIRAAGPAADMWIFGMKILGISSILGSINFIVTILKMKHPDLPLMKVSLFAWSILMTSFMIIVSMPTLASALIMMYTDRLGISGFFNPAMGGDPIAYQHLFWFTFHPEVYIFLIPAVGMAYELNGKDCIYGRNISCSTCFIYACIQLDCNNVGWQDQICSANVICSWWYHAFLYSRSWRCSKYSNTFGLYYA